MISKLRFLILILGVVIVWKVYHYFAVLPEQQASDDNIMSNESKINKIKVTVYYEALCSDSRNFIIKQLVPTYDKLGNYIELDLVPYGKAKTIEHDGEITFQCQHAALECLANKIHACGLAQVSNPNLQLKYVACMINDNILPQEIGEKCARDLRIPYDPIDQCVNSKKGSLLLKSHGIRTHAVSPAITFIPTIELNASQEIPLVKILKDLTKELCGMFKIKPAECL